MTRFDLPPALKAAVDRETGGRGAAELRAGAAGLSRDYRAGGRSAESMDFGAYLAARLPATFAAITRALMELRRCAPDFAPQSFADVGSGPGTASWAAAEIWPGIGRFTLIDNNRVFLDLALNLAQELPALAKAAARHGDMVAVEADLVVAAYALAELDEARAGNVTAALWNKCVGALAIIEPGTPGGFARVRRAREALIAAGAVIAAPCGHAGACPMTGGDWCHFSQRLPRSRLHMRAKAAAVPFEDERFAFVIATRFPVAQGGQRVLAPPGVSKAAVRLKLCTGRGIEMLDIARRHGGLYKRARKTGWGDVF